MTISEVRELMTSIDIERPSDDYRNKNYITWSCWRDRAVRYSIMEFGIKLTEWGYDVAVCDDQTSHFLYAAKDGLVCYLQYESLLHSFNIVADFQRKDVPCDENMHIIAGEEDCKKLFTIRHNCDRTLSDVDKYGNKNYLIHIIKAYPIMKYKDIIQYPLGTRIKARRAAKYKTVYPSGKVFQTDDLYGEERLVRPEQWYEGVIAEGPLIRKGKPHPTKTELYLMTDKGGKIRLRNLDCFEIVKEFITKEEQKR